MNGNENKNKCVKAQFYSRRIYLKNVGHTHTEEGEIIRIFVFRLLPPFLYACVVLYSVLLFFIIFFVPIIIKVCVYLGGCVRCVFALLF